MSKGVLLINLGSPESTELKDIKKYLTEFLMDKYVIDYPYLFRSLLVKGIIIPNRSKNTQQAYKKVWGEKGSPLIYLTEDLKELVNDSTSVPVEMAMRYAKPSIEDGLRKLADQGVDDVLLIPLYPQYAMSTTKTVLLKADQVRKKHFSNMKFTEIPAFYNHEDYIKVLSNSIQPYVEKDDADFIIFSYHGLPERHIRKTDITKSHCKIDKSCCQTPSEAHQFCYRHQCYATTEAVAKSLGLKSTQYKVTFQSRLGRDPWLQPYTDQTIEELAKAGVKNLKIVCPAFVTDCLETIEEIGIEGKEEFLENGGESYELIPCLNTNHDWVMMLSRWADQWANS